MEVVCVFVSLCVPSVIKSCPTLSYRSVAKSCPTLCDPMDCSMPGFPVHSLPEFAQNHVHWVGDGILPSHPLLPASPQALNLSQYQGPFNESALCIRWPKYWSSASVLPMNIQGWFPLGLTGLIFLQSKGLSRVFSSTTIQNYLFFGAQLSLWSTYTFICDYWKHYSFDYADLC